MRTNYHQINIEDILNKYYVFVEKTVAIRLFSEDKCDYIAVWMITITTKANQVDMDQIASSKVDNIQSPSLFLKSGFFSLWI